MALSLITALRNSLLTEISALADAGAAGATISLYTTPQPATANDAATGTLLATLTMSVTSFQAPVSGAMTANAITGDASADATGTAVYFRLEDSDSNTVCDGTVGLVASGADLELNTTSITAGIQVDITSMVLNADNV